ncbi:transcription antitermination factor NusB [Niabella ginsenosidivorans]|uniref:Transcription antitermination factor NusB n=1 Tax=Niabella ginsenosidivorans TaxID=1176587 RepID=A0A1A9I393_9BACT|nr:transcription antitermination factor NusB [Niabella ginsenosidivorans]ANH81152.1 transcription antitermination factor NusB [Niabella ginsenosidivorans]
MISRRNIRVKVMQTLYAYSAEATQESKAPSPSRILDQHFNQTRSLFVYLIYFLTQVARYAEKDAHKRASKFIPSATDLNVNTKLAGSSLLWQILEDKLLEEQLKKEKPEQLIDEELVKKIYNQLTKTAEYHHYISVKQQSKQEDRKIFEFILNDYLLGNEDFIAHVEELFSNWNDDGEMVAQLMQSYLHKPGTIKFQEIISPDKSRFAHSLLSTVIEKNDYLLDFITPKLKNWDPDRIALLDMVIMKMGVAEFLYFETIPPKVTINEYIDLAKEYSTAQSGHFVNGILDNIHKELAQQGRLKKTDYKKA